MAKIAIFGQNWLCDSASTIRPKARSLSAMQASGVGQLAAVPLVWSFGRQMMTRFGYSPRASNSANSRMKKSARNWSGTLISHPTAPGGENGRIDSIAGSDAKITSSWLIPSRQARKQAAKSG